MKTNENAIQGKRVDRPDDSIFESGEYGKGSNGIWYCCPPDTELMGNLSKHEVVEHENGTITVRPSILIRSPHKGTEWHGFLENGIWREV
jgi:hypothetical protein